jgi:hypothetical protein
MTRFLPINNYTDIYFHTILLVVLIIGLYVLSFSGFSKDSFVFIKKSGIIDLIKKLVASD